MQKKIFDKIQHLFIIKTPNHLEIDENDLNIGSHMKNLQLTSYSMVNTLGNMKTFQH